MKQANQEKVCLQDLVKALEEQKLKKRDIIVPSTALSMYEGRLALCSEPAGEMAEMLAKAGIKVNGNVTEEFEVMESCHVQLSEKLGIPGRYYERMRAEATDMLDYNVTQWLKRKPTNYFLRTFTSNDGEYGIARAFLSDRFKVIDHLDILITALEAIRSTTKNVVIDSADLTNQRMYIRFVAPDVVQKAPEILKNYKVPDGGNNHEYGVCSGFILSNSETGHGTFTVSPRLMILACKNGMIMHKDRIAEKHLGSKMELGTFDWSESTRAKELELIQAQVYDAVNAYLSHDYLGRIIEDITNKGTKILEHPIETVQNIGLYYNYPEERKKSLLNYFVMAGDMTGFGAVQSITYLAQKVQPDERYDMEIASMNVLENIERFDRPLAKSYTQLLSN